jgi:DNA-binding MarR family transcriptional regulator
MSEPFRLEAFLPFRLNLVASEVSERLSEVYGAEIGVDVPQWRILAQLAARGESTAQEIAHLTFSHKSTVSRAVRELEARGLVDRLESTVDKRALRLRMTAEGRRLFARLQPLVLGFEAALMDGLKKNERLALMKGLAALEGALRGTREQAT